MHATSVQSFYKKSIFDTGAGSCYIYNRAIAEKIGVKFPTTDTILQNNGTIRCILGMVDSLEMGGFFIKKQPVYVNIETTDVADTAQIQCDSIFNSAFDIVLGMQIIRQLVVVEFDFVKNTMSFPQKTKALNKPNLYIENTVLFMNMEICNANFLTFFDMGGAEGLSINTNFYEQHKPCILTKTEAEEKKGAVGACNKSSLYDRYIYNCPKINIKINDCEITMTDDCTVAKDKENDDQYGTDEGGFLGNIILKYCKKAVFDFENMGFSVEK